MSTSPPPRVSRLPPDQRFQSFFEIPEKEFLCFQTTAIDSIRECCKAPSHTNRKAWLKFVSNTWPSIISKHGMEIYLERLRQENKEASASHERNFRNYLRRNVEKELRQSQNASTVTVTIIDVRHGITTLLDVPKIDVDPERVGTLDKDESLHHFFALRHGIKKHDDLPGLRHRDFCLKIFNVELTIESWPGILLQYQKDLDRGIKNPLIVFLERLPDQVEQKQLHSGASHLSSRSVAGEKRQSPESNEDTNSVQRQTPSPKSRRPKSCTHPPHERKAEDMPIFIHSRRVEDPLHASTPNLPHEQSQDRSIPRHANIGRKNQRANHLTRYNKPQTARRTSPQSPHDRQSDGPPRRRARLSTIRTNRTRPRVQAVPPRTLYRSQSEETSTEYCSSGISTESSHNLDY
ncbi:hypothetical protein J1614_012284 [Plenodomus biglobosus]|nr:hypothetical protein J1614_012284 [Plenodomus biglobosus]